MEAVAERLKGRAGNPKLKANSGNISPIEIGRTTDLAAAKAGFGSGKTLEAAQKVLAQGAPELVRGWPEIFPATSTARVKKLRHT